MGVISQKAQLGSITLPQMAESIVALRVPLHGAAVGGGHFQNPFSLFDPSLCKW